MSLFDLNVRYYLNKSTINKQIISTLTSSKGQNNFHLLNNGITISCTGIKDVDNGNERYIKVNKPQIINGCQTVISIYKAFGALERDHNIQNFKSKCFVPVRFIITSDHELLGDIVNASNNQNKMSERNLRSNSRTQRVLQRKFTSFKTRWFYQKKDGEFESLRSFKDPSFKPRFYRYNTTKFRLIDNEELAKSWLSFIGRSTDASEKITAFELHENNGKYEWLFERTPNDEHWLSISKGQQVVLSDSNFHSRTPDPEQYLLSYLIFNFVRHYLPTSIVNKRECKKRLLDDKSIHENSTPEEISKAMLNDEKYVINLILSNMKEVIVEMYTWIFVRKYGPIKKDIAERLLSLHPLRDLLAKPEFKECTNKLKENTGSPDLNNVMFTCFEFIKEAVTRWYSTKGHEYRASQRRIRFLHSPKTIEQMKQFMDKTNIDTMRSEYAWKPPIKQFIESMPSLPDIVHFELNLME